MPATTGSTSPAANRPGTVVEIIASDRPDSFLVRVDGRDQSLVDLEDPTRLGFDYLRRMADVIDGRSRPGQPLRIVHIGGAGLALPRYVAATRPGSHQIVLEPDEELTERVRSELPLPRRSGIRVRPVDGRRGLTQVRERSVGVVVLDAYLDGRVPGELLTVECFEQVARVLDAGGVFVANLTDHAPFALTRDVVGGLRCCWQHQVVGAEPSTLKGRRAGNLLVVASADACPGTALARAASVSAAPYRVLAGSRVSSSFGGGTVLRDAVLRRDAPDPDTR